MEHNVMVHDDGHRTTLHTERGDVDLTSDEYAVYNILSRDRFAVMPLSELAQRTALRLTRVDALCGALHRNIMDATGLDLVCPRDGGWSLERPPLSPRTAPIGQMGDGRSVVDHLQDGGWLRVDPGAVSTANLEIAMRSLARAAAVHELENDQSLAGAFYLLARTVCAEIGDRDYESVVQGARNYAELVLTGQMGITNDSPAP